MPAIKSGRKSGKAAATDEVNVGKRGSIIIPKGLVAGLGFAEKDRFAVRKTKAGLALKRL